jgi:hypothetical protein
MEFFEFVTVYDVARRQTPKLTQADFVTWAQAMVQRNQTDPRQQAVEMNRFETENVWTENGRPYFKIWPAVIPLLANVSIDVPIANLRLPFSAFVLRLPKQQNPLFVDTDHPVKSLMVFERTNHQGERTIYLWADIGEYLQLATPTLHWVRLVCSPNVSIEDSLNKTRMPNLPGLVIPSEINHSLLRLAVSICFLSTGMDRLIEPDVLSKDFAAYVEARRKGDAEKMQVISDRAVHRGKRGWNVGRHEQLRPLISRPHGTELGANRRPLNFRHQRRAHFRLLPSGNVTFIRQATVRPDLPPPEYAAAYDVR